MPSGVIGGAGFGLGVVGPKASFLVVGAVEALPGERERENRIAAAMATAANAGKIRARLRAGRGEVFCGRRGFMVCRWLYPATQINMP